VLAVVASLWAVLTPRPDVLISGEGQAAAIRSADGRLSLLHSGRDTFAMREWLAANGDDRTVKDASLNAGVRCDEVGCLGRLKDGRLVSMAWAPEAFLEDCTRAAVVVSAREAPGDCSALLIDRKVWRSQGAVALRWVGDRFEQTVARPQGIDRPWARAPALTANTISPARPVSPDATPRPEDLEAGDQ
jgi:competence protein ComEC